MSLFASVNNSISLLVDRAMTININGKCVLEMFLKLMFMLININGFCVCDFFDKCVVIININEINIAHLLGLLVMKTLLEGNRCCLFCVFEPENL